MNYFILARYWAENCPVNSLVKFHSVSKPTMADTESHSKISGETERNTSSSNKSFSSPGNPLGSFCFVKLNHENLALSGHPVTFDDLVS